MKLAQEIIIAQFMAAMQDAALAGIESLTIPAIDVANLFPMVGDDEDATRSTLMQDTIEVEIGDGELALPALTLRNQIQITPDGQVIDGRNRIMAVLRKFGAPACDWGVIVEEMAQDLAEQGDDASPMLASVMRSEEFRERALGSDWLARSIVIVDKHPEELFEDVIALNMARRDMTGSQRAAVAAQVTAEGNRRTKGTKYTLAAGAQAFGVSEKSVKRARYVRKHAPELFARILKGEMSVGGADAIVRKMMAAKEAPAEPALQSEKEEKGPAKTKTREVATPAAIEDALRSHEDSAELYTAIIDGLTKRGCDRKLLDALEEPLSAVLGVVLR